MLGVTEEGGKLRVEGLGGEFAVIFTGKFESAEAAELSWWHEQTHHAYKYMSAEMQERYGKAAMEYLEKEYPKVAEHIKDNMRRSIGKKKPWHILQRKQ